VTEAFPSWPTSDHKFWWMECRIKPRGKTQVLLVTVEVFAGIEYVKPWQDNNCYPRSICENWKARFKPCESTPIFDETTQD